MTRIKEEIQKMLERGFEFLENSVGEGEKLGYFMTSLSANREAAAFLGNHPCSSYFRHMDLMKMADEEEELRGQVAALQEQNKLSK